jgi:2-polyprenyl-3-methyl-5-hydroxy-6-metoxy-1,4-benzoquinol methylase
VNNTYVFDNHSAFSADHHDALATLLNPTSAAYTRQLLRLDGARCLEIGAGTGSFAVWLADQVGTSGQVLATDIKPDRIPDHPGLRVIRHDIVAEVVPEAGSWDFIHCRLVLNHLPARRSVLATLAAALAPNGVLLTEDWWSEPPEVWVAYTPDPADAVLLRAYHRASLAVLDAHGNDRSWATGAHQAMRAEGLAAVRTWVNAESWPGGSPGTRLLGATACQTRDELIEQGLTAAELDRVVALFRDPQTTFHGHRLYSTAGRRRP